MNNLSNTIITEAGALAYITAVEQEEALQRLDGALFGLSVAGVRDVAHEAAEDETGIYCAFTYDGRVLAN